MKRREEKKARLASTESKPIAGLRKKLGDLLLTLGKKPTSTAADRRAAKPVLVEPPSRKTKAAKRPSEVRTIAENPETCFALLVGVDEYETLGKLGYASSDAKALRDALLDIGFCRENIALCVSDGPRQTLPTKKNIDSAIDEILDAAAKAGKKSTIFIAFSGHGFETADGDAAFCPQDAAVKSKNKRQTVIRDTVVVINDLTARLREHPAEFKILLVDACRELADARGGNDELEGFQGSINATGIACLRSCSLGQKSFEEAEFKSGIFTHYFIEGLTGKAATNNDGGVTFLNACSYTSTHTRDYVRETRKKLQEPYHDFKGVDFFLRAPSPNEAEDNYRQGRALAWGLDGTKIDGFRALELLTKAANAGLNDAKAALAVLYYNGCEATPPNFKEAVKWANRAGDNNPIAQSVLGYCYKMGLAVNKDETEAKRLHEAAFKGFQELLRTGDDALILLLLSLYYYYGVGTKLDYAKAAEYCRRAADLQCAPGLSNLAGMLCLGTGVERDYAQAIQLYNDAIELNYSFAYANLGNCYREGMGVPQDYAKAVELYRQAVEKNDADGAVSLGICYAKGWGVERNKEEAVRFYRQASEWNNANGTGWLASCYYYGNGVEKDRYVAWDLWNRASEQNDLGAFSWVAECYKNGWGTEKNKARASLWSKRLFERWHEEAEAGSPYARYSLGECYYYGNGVEQDYVKAARCYKEAAQKDERDAVGWMGVCYYWGQGVKKNYKKAITYFQRADKLGWPDAKYWLGECYYYGNGVEQDFVKAATLYSDGAEKNVDAMNELGMCYQLGMGVEQDYHKAAYWFGRAAEDDDPRGFYNLGDIYFYALGGEQDYENAFNYYKRAADLGHAEAARELGRCYWEGKGVEQDYLTAIKYFRDAVKHNCASACVYLGAAYRDGHGVKPSDEEAVKWFKKGAELEDPSAMVLLAECYSDGVGVDKEPKKAARLYRKAAKLGDVVAMNRLGLCYAYGSGVWENKELMKYWWRKAAELGFPHAFYNFGVWYDGKDEVESTRCFCKAAELGNADAMFYAGMRYMKGLGVEQDLDETLKFWRSAGDLEEKRALRGLGEAAVRDGLIKAEEKFGVVLGPRESKDLTQEYADTPSGQASRGIVAMSDFTQEFNAALKTIGERIGLASGIERLEKAEKLGDEYSRVLLGMCLFYGVGVERDLRKAKKLFCLAAASDSEEDGRWIGVAENALDCWRENVAKLRAALEAEKERDGGESR